MVKVNSWFMATFYKTKSFNQIKVVQREGNILSIVNVKVRMVMMYTSWFLVS